MTRPGVWLHIADHAWDRHGVGCQYTVHKENDRWVARGFSLRAGGTAIKEIEEFQESLEGAKQLVERWERVGTCRRPWD